MSAIWEETINAKQLLGKEVTAALNEKIKANVAELQGKGVNPTLCNHPCRREPKRYLL